MEKTKTNYEILERVIKKAMDNGWKKEIISKTYGDTEAISSVDFAVRDIKKHMDLLIGNFIQYPRQMLFDHEFAKAYFGEATEWMYLSHGEDMDIVSEIPTKVEWHEDYEERNGWQYHLQQMVLCEEPLDYLKKFL